MSKLGSHGISVTALIVLAFLTMTAVGQTPQEDRPTLSNLPPAPLEQVLRPAAGRGG